MSPLPSTRTFSCDQHWAVPAQSTWGPNTVDQSVPTLSHTFFRPKRGWRIIGQWHLTARCARSAVSPRVHRLSARPILGLNGTCGDLRGHHQTSLVHGQDPQSSMFDENVRHQSVVRLDAAFCDNIATASRNLLCTQNGTSTERPTDSDSHQTSKQYHAMQCVAEDHHATSPHIGSAANSSKSHKQMPRLAEDASARHSETKP